MSILSNIFRKYITNYAALFILQFLVVSASAQSVSIDKTTVSGCYYYSGQSMTTISVQVAWSGANSNDILPFN